MIRKINIVIYGKMTSAFRVKHLHLRAGASVEILWRDGRAAEGACLENMFGESQRGFESHSLRCKLQVCMLTGFQVEY